MIPFDKFWMAAPVEQLLKKDPEYVLVGEKREDSLDSVEGEHGFM